MNAEHLIKLAWLNKAIPRRFPKVRNGLAGGLKKVRRATEPNVNDSKLMALGKSNGREAIRSATLHPDVAALYVGSQPFPVPSAVLTAGYSRVRKPISRKIQALIA